MNYFSGRQNNLLMMNFFSTNSTIFFFFFTFLSITIFPETILASNAENPILNELSAREDMVQMAGYGEEKISTVVVSGTVLCEACSSGDAPQRRRIWPVQGALVAIQCPTRRKRGRSHRELVATTDGYGDFTMDLPSDLHAIPNLESVCCVKVLRVPKHSGCKPAFVRKHKALTLASSKNGIRSYSAGEISFLHSASKPSQACTKRGNAKGQAW